VEPAATLALIGAGGFFLVGLLTGTWRAVVALRSPVAEARRYVILAHRASLQYSFAAIVLFELARFSRWTAPVNLASVATLLGFFAMATATYIVHAALGDTDNQFRQPYQIGEASIPAWLFRPAVWLLAVAEVAGFAVLLVGALRRLVTGGG